MMHPIKPSSQAACQHINGECVKTIGRPTGGELFLTMWAPARLGAAMMEKVAQNKGCKQLLVAVRHHLSLTRVCSCKNHHEHEAPSKRFLNDVF